MSLLAFSPILALVALLSTEVAAESITAYSTLVEGGYVDGFPMEFTVNVDPSYTISTAGDAEGCMNSELSTCSATPVSWDNSDTVDVVANIPAGVPFPEGMTPTTIEFRMCFSPSSTVDRKWRKINDPFKKDNSCANGATAKVDWAEGEVTATLTPKSVTPTGLFTVRAYVSCDQLAPGEFCHIVNKRTADDTGDLKLYFNTQVMDSRPNNMYVAVIICALIGPLMLTAFLIYERGILAKQA